MARTNLAPIIGLVAAAALLVDYVMTVAVSTAAAIAQIQSVIPERLRLPVVIAFMSISLITLANLRGLRESGNIFAVPTYLFVGLALLDRSRSASINMVGSARSSRPSAQPDAVPFPDLPEALGHPPAAAAFAGGSVALTGVEAIANGVPAFKRPSRRTPPRR